MPTKISSGIGSGYNFSGLAPCWNFLGFNVMEHFSSEERGEAVEYVFEAGKRGFDW